MERLVSLKQIGVLRSAIGKIEAKVIEVQMRTRLSAYIRGIAGKKLPHYNGERRTLALIMSCFNHAKFLPAAIRSVEAQTRKPDEIILIDDFTKYAWEVVGGFYPEKERRVVPFSDRDFQLRVNSRFPVGVFPKLKLGFWRDGNSVDAGINS